VKATLVLAGELMNIQLKRLYGDAAQNDGYRELVDGMWRRGILLNVSRLSSNRRRLLRRLC
jgi:uncharacterized protein YeaO (DUF488 family)